MRQSIYHFEDLNVAAELLNADLVKIAEWALKWLIDLIP